MTETGERQALNSMSRKAQREDRRLTVSDLLMCGKTFRQIAVLCGCSLGTVHNDVEWIREQWRERAAATYGEHVAAEIAKLDRLSAAFMPQAMDGEIDALNGLLRLADRRARLLGLDQPARTEAVVTVSTSTPLDESIEELLAQMATRDVVSSNGESASTNAG